MPPSTACIRLPAPRLRVVSTFPHPAHPWLAFGEEVLDAEVVHAIAPGAALTIVLVKGNSLDSAGQAVAASVAALRLGASQGGIISLSPAGQIGGEHCVDRAQLTRLNAALQDDAAHHVTVVAASGDTGAAGEPCALIDALTGSISHSFTPRKEPVLVASDPLILSVGGTTLHASHKTGTWTGETTWGLPDGSPGTGFQASGGGFSHLFRRPSYQAASRASAQPAASPTSPPTAIPAPGYRSYGQRWRRLHDQRARPARARARPCGPGSSPSPTSTRTRHLGFVNPAIYQIARGPRTTRPSTTSPPATATRPSSPATTITGYRAGPGWDPVTGWGSPDAQVLVPLLARYATP